MNQQEKTDTDRDIMNLINKLIDNPEDTKNAIMYVRGDSEFQTASVNIKGDPRLAAQTIQHFLDTNQEFKRFILSIIGSWIAKNPIEEKMFLNGLEIAKKTFSIN